MPDCADAGRPRHAVHLRDQHRLVDRSTGICASLYGNFLPFVPPEAVALYNNFEVALYASL